MSLTERYPADAASRSAADVFALRQTYWCNDYRPVPVYTGEKRPRGNNWRADALSDPPLWTVRPPEPEALSTGLATGKLIAADVDVLIQGVADRIVWEIEQVTGPTPLVRIGLAPKRLLAFRCEAPFRKLTTGVFTMPDDTEAEVEILADGQQFVADGIHPDTRKPYIWPNGSPEIVPLADLLSVTLKQAQAIIARADEILRANGGIKKKEKARRERTRAPKALGGGANAETFFTKVNAVAMANLAAWVTTLFPTAVYQPGTGAWRVASKDRGRPDLQEAISFHPDGIQDFGLEQGLTPLDAVIEHGGAPDAVEAARWLCDRLSIEPAALGWQETRPARGRSSGNGAAPPTGSGPPPPEPDPDPRPVPPPVDPDDDFVWGEPIDIFADLIGTPELRRDHLPDAIAPFAFDVAERMGVAPSAVALGCNVTCSAVIHDEWQIQPKQNDDEWRESARLWGLLLGPPGAMKTPIIRTVTAIIDRLESQAGAQHAKAMKQYRKALAQWEKDGGDKADKPDKPRRPRQSRRLIENATTEAISEVLRDDAEARYIASKVLVRQDELSEFIANLDRYRAGGRGGGDRGAYLRLDNGGRYVIDRIQRGSFAVPNWSACFLGGCQPEPIQRIAKEAVDDGLIQRFLCQVSDPASEGIDRAPDRDGRARYEAIVEFLALLGGPYKGPAGRSEPIVLQDDARPYFDIVRRLAQAFRYLPDVSPQLRSTLDKLPGRFCRIALTFHMIEAAADAIARSDAAGEQPELPGLFDAAADNSAPPDADAIARRDAGEQPDPVPRVLAAETARRAAGYVRDIILPHLLRADALMFSTIQTEHARRIAGFIAARQVDEIEMREIVQYYKPLRAPEHAPDRASIMDAFVIAAWLEPIPPRYPTRPVTRWRINPLVRQRFAARAEAEAQRRAKAREAIEALATKSTFSPQAGDGTA